jgi:hypothetical protein
MKNILFDASKYAAGLDPAYDATQTHFSFLDDNEITGAASQPWLAQVGENLHVTFQDSDTDRKVVYHYYYNKNTVRWRYHGYTRGSGGAAAPRPYSTHDDPNLKRVQADAVLFGWPPGNVVVKTASLAKTAKAEKKVRQKAVQQAKKEGQEQRKKAFLEELDESPRKAVRIEAMKPVRFPPPPGGMVTETYMKELISKGDRDSLLYLYVSDDWPLAKWEAGAWSAFLDWLVKS